MKDLLVDLQLHSEVVLDEREQLSLDGLHSGAS